MRRLGSRCLWDRDETAGETNCCIVRDVLPTTAQRYDGTVAEFEKYLKVRDIHGAEELLDYPILHELGHLCVQYLGTCFASGTLGPGEAGTLIPGFRHHARLARSCGADLEEITRLYPGRRGGCIEVGPLLHRTPVSLECGSVRLAPKRPRTLSLFDAPFVSLFVASSRGHATSMVRRKEFRWIPINTLPKTCRTKGYAAQSHMLSKCPGICRLVNTMKASIPDHRLDTAIWKFTPAQHFAYFQRQLRIRGVSHQQYTLHGRRGGGTTDYWQKYRDLPQLRRRGRWTSERTLGRYIQEGTFRPHQNRLPAEIGNCLSALADLAQRFFAEQGNGKPRHQTLQPPRCNGKRGGVRSLLRSEVEQQSFANSVSLGALPQPLSDMGRKTEYTQSAHDTGTDIGMDRVASRVLSRLGAAFFFVFASCHQTPTSQIYEIPFSIWLIPIFGLLNFCCCVCLTFHCFWSRILDSVSLFFLDMFFPPSTDTPLHHTPHTSHTTHCVMSGWMFRMSRCRKSSCAISGSNFDSSEVSKCLAIQFATCVTDFTRFPKTLPAV